jgi:hypothetical protein
VDQPTENPQRRSSSQPNAEDLPEGVLAFLRVNRKFFQVIIAVFLVLTWISLFISIKFLQFIFTQMLKRLPAVPNRFEFRNRQNSRHCPACKRAGGDTNGYSWASTA